MSKIAIADQIAEIRDELQMRSFVYPKQVARNALPPHRAAEKMARMHAALATLEWVEANAETIRAAHHALITAAASRVQQTFPGSQIVEAQP